MSGYRALRRRILTPNMSATKLDVRGFNVKDAASQQLLETVGATFLTGYGHAVEARTVAECEQRLEQVPERFRGFAYEGAAMGYAILDGLPFGSSRQRRRSSWPAAAASTPTWPTSAWVGRWPGCPGSGGRRSRVADPLMRWLVLDGFGFHQAYFATEKYVTRQYQEPEFPWPAEGPQWYANHAIDQGIGRAMWFVGGTEAELVATMIEKFPESRQPDLWSGAGLAATYAGGADAQELEAFYERAGKYRPQVAQGSAFASTARLEAGLLVPHTGVATQVFCGMDPGTGLAGQHRLPPEPVDTEDLPAYELWRQRIAAAFVDLGRV